MAVELTTLNEFPASPDTANGALKVPVMAPDQVDGETVQLKIAVLAATGTTKLAAAISAHVIDVDGGEVNVTLGRVSVAD